MIGGMHAVECSVLSVLGCDPEQKKSKQELRATCLGEIWRHRTEWDRTMLLRNLCDLVRDYVDELADGSVHMSLSPRP